MGITEAVGSDTDLEARTHRSNNTTSRPAHRPRFSPVAGDRDGVGMRHPFAGCPGTTAAAGARGAVRRSLGPERRLRRGGRSTDRWARRRCRPLGPGRVPRRRRRRSTRRASPGQARGAASRKAQTKSVWSICCTSAGSVTLIVLSSLTFSPDIHTADRHRSSPPFSPDPRASSPDPTPRRGRTPDRGRRVGCRATERSRQPIGRPRAPSARGRARSVCTRSEGRRTRPPGPVQARRSALWRSRSSTRCRRLGPQRASRAPKRTSATVTNEMTRRHHVDDLGGGHWVLAGAGEDPTRIFASATRCGGRRSLGR